RHRRRAGAALASPATEERAAAGLLFIRARCLFALPALAQGGRMKLIGALCSLGSWRDRRRGRRLRWLDRGRHLRLRAVLDDRPMILAGERILPLEGVEPAADRRDRQPVVG